MALATKRAQRLEHRDQRLLDYVIDLRVTRAEHTIDHTRQRWPHSIEEAPGRPRVPAASEPCQRRQLGSVVLTRRGRGGGRHEQAHFDRSSVDQRARAITFCPQMQIEVTDFLIPGAFPPQTSAELQGQPSLALLAVAY